MTKKRKRPTVTVCCSVCGSDEVEYAIWYAPNTGAAGDLFGSWNAGDNTFCAACDVDGRNPNPELVDKGADPRAFRAARRRRVAQE